MRYVWILFAALMWLAPLPAKAQLSQYNWQPFPMISGEVANIAISPTNPNIMYLGIEVNSHSMYKSEDGGKSWKLVHSGDHTKDVAIHPTNPDIAFYADSQSLFRTTTGGTGDQHYVPGHESRSSFQKVIDNQSVAGPSSSSFSSITPSLTNPNVWYAAVRGSDNGPFGKANARLFKSTDTGATFTEIKGQYDTITVLLAETDTRLLVGADDGVYLSTDGGQTLSQLTKAEAVTDLTLLRTPEAAIYLAATANGVLRSEDNGASWQTIPAGLPNTTVLRLRPLPSQPLVVWATTLKGAARSNDGGKTWQDASGNLESKQLQALAVHPTNPDIAYVATETFIFSVRSETRLFKQGQYYRQGLYRTEDGGKTWVRSDKGLEEVNLIDITTHPKRPYEVWAAQQSSRGLYRSRDAGQTWSLTPRLLTHYPMRLVFFPDSDDKLAHTSLHTGEDFGITTDSGKSWQTWDQKTFFDVIDRGKHLLDTNKTQGGSNLHLHGVAIDPKNPSTMYVGSVDDPSTQNVKPLKGAHIFKSTDGGKSWKESDDGYDHDTATSINDIKIDPLNTSTIYIGTTKKESTDGNGLWKSVDAGATWQRANTGMPDSTSVSTIIIHPTETNKLLAATFEGLYRSTDAGTSWTRVKQGLFKDIEYDPANPTVVYTGSGPEGGEPSPGGENGIFMSANFGETWQTITNNLPSGKITTVGVNSTGKIVYAGVEGYGLFAAIDPSAGTIPIDPATGVEFGTDFRQGPRGYEMTDHNAVADLLGHSGHEPPTWAKAAVIGTGLLVIGGVAWLVIRFIRHRKAQP